MCLVQRDLMCWKEGDMTLVEFGLLREKDGMLEDDLCKRVLRGERV